MVKIAADKVDQFPMHPACREYTRSTGYASFYADEETDWGKRYNEANQKRGLCVGCGTSLLCNGVNQNHQWEELSREECARRKITHLGFSYHVEECKVCKSIQSYDSGD